MASHPLAPDVSLFLTLMALLLLGIFSGLALQRNLEQDLDAELKIQFRVVQTSLEISQTLNRYVQDALDTPDGNSVVWVYENKQLLIGAGFFKAIEPLDASFFTTTENTRIGSVGAWRVLSWRKGSRIIQMGRSLKNMQRVLAIYQQNASIIGVVLALLTGGITLILARRRTGQLEQLALWADGKTMLQKPVPWQNKQNEIGVLARALETCRVLMLEVRQKENRFLADAAHELRTPITAIQTMLELRRKEPRTAVSDQETMQKTEQQMQHLQALAQNLLTLTNTERTICATPIDLLEIAGNATDLLAPLAVQKNLEIRCYGQAGLLMGDAILMARAIENLIANGIKFTDTGSIEIQVQSTTNTVWLEVSDTGIGIAATVQSDILEPFHRIGTREGSGLGLAVVQAVVRAHKGQLEIDSSQSRGTRIRMTFHLDLIT